MLQHVITADNLPDLIRLMPDAGRQALAGILRHSLSSALAQPLIVATAAYLAEQERLNRWVAEYEAGGGLLSKTDEHDYWVQ